MHRTAHTCAEHWLRGEFPSYQKYFYDPINDRYLLAGRVGETASSEEANDFNDMSL